MPQNTALSGIYLRLLSAFLITAMSAAVHEAAKAATIGQIMFWRSAISLFPILVYMWLRGDLPAALHTRHPWLHATRGTLGAFTMAMSFLSLAYLPVANAQALAFLAPVLVIPLAALTLRERISPGLIFAVAIGFAGAITLLWDALEQPKSGAIIGVAAGIAFALTMAFLRVHTKKMTATEKPATIAFYFSIISTLVGLSTLPFGWNPVTGTTTFWLILAGILGGLAHIASTEAVARSPISTLAPFDFTTLIWALAFDVILFAQAPGLRGMAGIVLITGAALYVAIATAKGQGKRTSNNSSSGDGSA